MPLPPSSLLRSSVSGPVFFPEDDGFADEASVFNMTVAHRPHVIIGATSVADVQAAVLFARDRDLPVAVLNTGHGPSVSVPGEAVMITTRRMTEVRIDGARQTARVEAGVRWGQVVEEAAEVGLAPLAGSSPQVGVVGYTLGGGVSIAMGRAFGYAADHVLEIDVVTADGELRHVTPDSDEDLFFALLGGKGNFGVVTAMEFSLFPVRELYAGALHFSGDDARNVLHAYQRFTSTAPDELTSSIVFLRAPDLPFIPDFMRGKLTVSIRVAYLGSARDGETLVAPLRAAAPVLADTVTLMPFAHLASITNDPTEPGAAVEHFVLLDELSPAAMEAILDVAGPGSGTRITMVNLTQLGGAFGTPPETANAVGRRDAAFAAFALTAVPPGDVSASKDEGLELIDRLSSSGGGRKHPSYLSPADASADGVRLAYDELTYKRLQAAKTAYDPRNMFRYNHNIPPLA
ncbi:FAD-binding oxidoreductase [Planotetraspora kaengkrachanensis]|uniref:Oxidoreductase n=1 Tax=Planotetraspora kaengkrachanensis TaxID=575193 RepID=A0A8J3Q1U3_9ACTN|nr:FAD-binding oxidoreductase [Planotetraspora kaengkrachanensis]GIG85053.1 oxidoreductase [Planotetraspora kaengkrachanensis]